ncbi:MAG: SCP2 sterol-binding domain-containing protein [Dehalococcoidia bacterium]
MNPTKDQIKLFYSQALQRCLDAFAQLDDKEWAKKVSEFTAKEHLAQLVSTTETETLPLSRQAVAGEKASIPGFEKRADQLPFRAAAMAEVKDLPVSELLERLQSGVSEHIAMLDGISEEDLDKPTQSPGWDRPGTVRDLFFAGYLFLPGQYQDIRKANKKKLPHWVESGTPDQVNFQMGRIFHYMPLIFRSDRGADLTATYQFTMEGAGGGQWSLAIADGRADATDGEVAEHDIEIKTKPNLWIDLTTGELNAPMAIMTRKVKIGGNAGLAMKLSDLFSAEG